MLLNRQGKLGKQERHNRADQYRNKLAKLTGLDFSTMSVTSKLSGNQPLNPKLKLVQDLCCSETDARIVISTNESTLFHDIVTLYLAENKQVQLNQYTRFEQALRNAIEHDWRHVFGQYNLLTDELLARHKISNNETALFNKLNINHLHSEATTKAITTARLQRKIKALAEHQAEIERQAEAKRLAEIERKETLRLAKKEAETRSKQLAKLEADQRVAQEAKQLANAIRVEEEKKCKEAEVAAEEADKKRRTELKRLKAERKAELERLEYQKVNKETIQTGADKLANAKRIEAEQRVKQEAEQRAKQEAEQRVKQEAEQRVKQEAEQHAETQRLEAKRIEKERIEAELQHKEAELALHEALLIQAKIREELKKIAALKEAQARLQAEKERIDQVTAELREHNAHEDINNTYHDSIVDGNEQLILFNKLMIPIATFATLSYKCDKLDSETCKAQYTYKLLDGEYFVINPLHITGRMRPCTSHAWLVKDLVLGDMWLIDTYWNLKFIEGLHTLPDKPDPTVTYVVPNLSGGKNVLRVHILPMLETIRHIRLEYALMTLIQIATSINGSYIEMFKNTISLCNYLYDKFAKEFNDICLTERIPIEKVYRSEFRITFKYTGDLVLESNIITQTRTMKNVVMIAASYITSKVSYGNIPWCLQGKTITDDKKSSIVNILSPFIFFKEDIEYRSRPSARLYDIITIFPNLTYDNQLYSAGSYIGVLISGTDTREIIVRGELFGDMSVKEHLMLIEMYKAYITGKLSKYTSVTSLFKELQLSDNDNIVREGFISMLVNELIRQPVSHT